LCGTEAGNLFLLDRIIITRCWVFCCVFRVDFFQTNGGLKFNSFSIFSQIFSFLTLVVYLVSVTTYWRYFSWAIYFLPVNLDHVIVTYCWVFRCIFVIFNSNKFNSYPVSLPNFSFLPLEVNPVGMTTYWCYFLQIIVYNFMTIYGIATKFGIRMCLYPAFQCTKFQGN